MMPDENHKIYCPRCLVRTDFVNEMSSYTCDRCEGVFNREELLDAREVATREWKRKINTKQRPLGEFL
jgi:transposase-like protein